jgi:hypothetical protein
MFKGFIDVFILLEIILKDFERFFIGGFVIFVRILFIIFLYDLNFLFYILVIFTMIAVSLFHEN